MRNASGIQIMLVEDDENIATPLTKLLALRNFQVQWAHSGSEALKMLDGPVHPDCLLVDVMMPGMSGWQFQERLRNSPDSQICTLPLIFLSADNQSKQEAEQIGETFISKPIDLEALVKAIHKVCETEDGAP